MSTKYAAHNRPGKPIQQFVKTNIETASKYRQETDQSILPVSLNRSAAIDEPEKRKLPLFMEPLFKAKEFDPL